MIQDQDFDKVNRELSEARYRCKILQKQVDRLRRHIRYQDFCIEYLETYIVKLDDWAKVHDDQNDPMRPMPVDWIDYK